MITDADIIPGTTIEWPKGVTVSGESTAVQDKLNAMGLPIAFEVRQCGEDTLFVASRLSLADGSASVVGVAVSTDTMRGVYAATPSDPDRAFTRILEKIGYAFGKWLV